MVAAERWYEHQDNYKKYGIEMRPESAPRVRTKKRQNVSPKDRAAMLLFAVFIGVLCIGAIIATAYSASLKYEINSMIAANEEIKRDIETLNVKIKTSVNIATVEERAINELGMVYPMSHQIVYISSESEPSNDFAMLLKEQAYN